MRPMHMLLAVLFVSLTLFGCDASHDDDPAGATSMKGTVTDGSGDGVPGAFVVVGESSATGFTDENGNFDVPTTGPGRQPVRVIVPGYLSPAKSCNPGGGISFELDEDDDCEQSPAIVVNSLVEVPGGIAVNVTITPVGDSTIVDARAEVVGAVDGVVLTAGGGNVYTGIILTANLQDATVLIFAVDSAGRHSEATGELNGGPPVGSISGSLENWVGTMWGRHLGGFNYGRHSFNQSLTVQTDGSIEGIAASLQLWLLVDGQSPLVVDNISGSAQHAGRYCRMEIHDDAGKIAIALTGVVKPDNSIYTGVVDGWVEGKPYFARFLFVNKEVAADPWWSNSLAHTWGLSFYHFGQATRTPGHYQYNVLLDVDSVGAIAPGTPTSLGQQTAGGATLSFAPAAGRNVGHFIATPAVVLDDGAEYTVYGMMGVGGHCVAGVWACNDASYGIFWGTRHEHWAEWNFNARWYGLFHITDGPDAGKTLLAGVRFNYNGEVVGAGFLAALPGQSLTGGNITVDAGDLTFVNTTAGAFTGSLSGVQGTLPVAIDMSTPTAPERASMGVFHGRLIGKFSISTNGDSGYYFLYRSLWW